MLRIYLAPDGHTYQYQEGEQPEGFVPVDASHAGTDAKRGASDNKRRAATNKRRTAANKGA